MQPANRKSTNSYQGLHSFFLFSTLFFCQCWPMLQIERLLNKYTLDRLVWVVSPSATRLTKRYLSQLACNGAQQQRRRQITITTAPVWPQRAWQKKKKKAKRFAAFCLTWCNLVSSFASVGVYLLLVSVVVIVASLLFVCIFAFFYACCCLNNLIHKASH